MKNKDKKLDELYEVFEIINHCFYKGKLKLQGISYMKFADQRIGGSYSHYNYMNISYDNYDFESDIAVFLHELAHLIVHQYYRGKMGHGYFFMRVWKDTIEKCLCLNYKYKFFKIK